MWGANGQQGVCNGGSDLIAEENAEKDAANEEEHARKIVFAENNIGDDEQKGDPNEHLGGIPRQTIEIKGRTSVEKESDDLIHDAKNKTGCRTMETLDERICVGRVCTASRLEGIWK